MKTLKAIGAGLATTSVVASVLLAFSLTMSRAQDSTGQAPSDKRDPGTSTNPAPGSSNAAQISNSVGSPTRATAQQSGSPPAAARKGKAVIVNRRGQETSLEFAPAPYNVEGFLQRQKEYDEQLRNFRLAEERRLQQEEKQRQLEALRQAEEERALPYADAARKSPAEVQAILQKAFHQATLDRAMEDGDGNTYRFKFPAAFKLPDQFKARAERLKSGQNNAADVAAIPQLKEAWFEARLVSIRQFNEPGRSGSEYGFEFPNDTLSRLGLLEAQPTE